MLSFLLSLACITTPATITPSVSSRPSNYSSRSRMEIIRWRQSMPKLVFQSRPFTLGQSKYALIQNGDRLGSISLSPIETDPMMSNI
jgi:hypothetical protein